MADAGRSTQVLLALTAVAGIALVVLALYVLPGTLVDDQLRPVPEAKALSDARDTLLQALGGLVVVVGLAFAGRTVWLTREGQLTGRFTAAVDQLGDEHRLTLRMGGVKALERVAQNR